MTGAAPPPRGCGICGQAGRRRSFTVTMMRVSRVVILALLLVLCAGGPAANGADQAAGNKKELRRIKREMAEKKKKLRQADKKERSVLSELDRIDRDIQAGAAELAEQQRRLRDAEAALGDVEKNNAEISRSLSGLRESYGRRVRALYKVNRSGYAGAVLASNDLDGALKRVKYLGIIAEQDRLLIREYGGALDRLTVRQAEISEKKASILDRKKAIEVKKAELVARKRKKAAILAGVRQEKGLYEQTLRELEESSASLWAMIKKSEQERTAAKAVRRPSPPQQQARAAGPGRGRLPWPVEGQVLTRFGMQHHPQFGTMVYRRGIEIQAREGEPVRAVADGQVAYADWYKGYGKMVILEHRPGFYTLYGNLSRLDVKNGDRAAGGQVIGLAGDTGSLKGSKLYFEIRQNGEAKDPLAWLAKR